MTMPSDQDDLREVRENTAAYIRGVVGANPEMQAAMSRADLVTLGKQLWPHSYARCQVDDTAFESLCQAFRETIRMTEKLGITDDSRLMLASSFLYMPMEQCLIFWSARWADQGFPVIQMGHKYAAALMSTAVNADIGDIRPPFKAFFLAVPKGVLSLTDPGTGKDSDIEYITVQFIENDVGERRWQFVATAGRVCLWRHGVLTQQMISNEDTQIDEGVDWTQYSFGLDVDDQDERAYFLIQRLILNVCLAMTSPSCVKPLGKTAQSSPGNMRSSSEPLVRVYQVGKPITLDCRPAIAAYLKGERKRVASVQSLVRGHWKRQAHGPGRTQRKWLWIEPYWRGPEDAPILTRPHKLEPGV